MSDDNRYPVPPRSAQLPATRSASIPSLQSNSGGFALTPKRRAEKDAAFARARADLIRSQADMHKAAIELSDARFDLAVALSKWHSLDEVCEHHYRRGFLTRVSELKVLTLDLETAEINARIARDAAMLTLAAYQPQPPAPSAPVQSEVAQPPPRPKGLTPDEVRAVLQRYPDVRPEAIEPIVMMLTGMLAEKNQ